jgi:hypothetical protein
MRSYVAVGALRERLGLSAPRPSRTVSRPLEHPFHNSTWQAEQAIREAVDSLVYFSRWRVLWLPAEPGPPVPRTYYLRGTHAEVMARAHAFFTSGTVVVDPAPFPAGPEVFDRRINLVTTGRASP